ncbi:hypothetical protein HA50_04420 [Pantoea cypripedii]|uniref:Uncharacterized protein n=1 Tax=Pantoea cypripedii TaxID=55209 RepID=A0A1X1ERM8_PANCY|nr:hypothetical protein HA50_04420 [Pantoea cypripedii]
MVSDVQKQAPVTFDTLTLTQAPATFDALAQASVTLDAQKQVLALFCIQNQMASSGNSRKDFFLFPVKSLLLPALYHRDTYLIY